MAVDRLEDDLFVVLAIVLVVAAMAAIALLAATGLRRSAEPEVGLEPTA
ncbi:MAG TPA: hypothetical protein VGB14_15030 [Acidimicrobiales bacterium]